AGLAGVARSRRPRRRRARRFGRGQRHRRPPLRHRRRRAEHAVESAPMNARRVGILLVIGTAACTARLYPGPTRPDVEVATIETDGMTVVAVDEQVAQPRLGPSRYEILAGMHAVSVRLNDNHPVFAGSAAGGHRVSDAALAVCFLARGKHVYLLRPLYAGAVWRVEVVDENVTGGIATKTTSAVRPAF